MKTQYRDPLGILNSLQNISRNPQIFNLLVEASEAFDLCMIRRNQHLSDDQKLVLTERASAPLTLLHQCRLALRRYLQLYPDLAPLLNELPLTLQLYLNYD